MTSGVIRELAINFLGRLALDANPGGLRGEGVPGGADGADADALARSELLGKKEEILHALPTTMAQLRGAIPRALYVLSRGFEIVVLVAEACGEDELCAFYAQHGVEYGSIWPVMQASCEMLRPSVAAVRALAGSCPNVVGAAAG